MYINNGPGLDTFGRSTYFCFRLCCMQTYYRKSSYTQRKQSSGWPAANSVNFGVSRAELKRKAWEDYYFELVIIWENFGSRCNAKNTYLPTSDCSVQPCIRQNWLFIVVYFLPEAFTYLLCCNTFLSRQTAGHLVQHRLAPTHQSFLYYGLI